MMLFEIVLRSSRCVIVLSISLKTFISHKIRELKLNITFKMKSYILGLGLGLVLVLFVLCVLLLWLVALHLNNSLFSCNFPRFPHKFANGHNTSSTYYRCK